MSAIRNLAVYCGSSSGTHPAHLVAAKELGAALAARGIGLVYGGGKVGLMGAVAGAALAGGGKAYGVIPASLAERELAHPGLTELHEVATLHARKARMTELADAFLCLAGGIGTFDELFEAWTWNALGYHAKPLCLLNTAGYWDSFLDFCDQVRDEGFMSAARREQLLCAATIDEALDRLEAGIATAQDGPVW